MRLLQQIRLKPWRDQKLIDAQTECPELSTSNGYEVCRIKNVQDYRGWDDINKPSMLNQMQLAFEPKTLAWDPVNIRLRNVFVNHFGHVFDTKRQFMHGGCQDYVDLQHGGYPRYSSDKDVKVVQRAINLVHLYGDNYYHFLIEVVPRLLMTSTFDYPVILRKGSPVHLLKELIGMEVLDIIWVTDGDLLHVRDLITPLAPRCLHTPKPLWSLYKEHLNLNLGKPSTVVYSSRVNIKRRYIREEAQFLQLLSNQLPTKVGLKILYGNETFQETKSVLKDAKVYIGSHGAALSNVILTPQAHLIEIHKGDYYNPCFLYLANTMDIQHTLIEASSGSRDTYLTLDPQLQQQIVDVVLKALAE